MTAVIPRHGATDDTQVMATRKPARRMTAKAVFQRMRRDHRDALDRVGALEARLRRSGRAGVAETEALSDVLDLLGLPFDAHMVAEDEALYPAILAAIPGASGSIESLFAEHAEIRQMLRRLRELADEPDKTDAEQLRVQVHDLAELLRLHIAKEETLVFRLAPQLLVPREIAAVAAILTRRHATTPSRRPSTRSKGVSR
jgi:hemerythrin-like domain-containing protein